MFHRSRFGLRTLLIGMGGAAIGIAMLTRPNEWCWSVAATIKFFLLSIAIPLAISLRGSSRSFWSAFASTGWLFHFIVNGRLDNLGISAQGFVFVHLMHLAPEDWVSQHIYFHLVASEFSILFMAVLAGLFCYWATQEKPKE